MATTEATQTVASFEEIDPNDPQFRARLKEITNMGREESMKATQVSNSILQRPSLAGKDSETIFDFFQALASDRIMREAREAAVSGDIMRAERFARLSATVTERLTVSDAYNLDRKQTILSLLDDMKAAL